MSETNTSNTYQPQTKEEKSFYEKYKLERQISKEAREDNEEDVIYTEEEKREIEIDAINNRMMEKFQSEAWDIKNNIIKTVIRILEHDAEDDLNIWLEDVMKDEDLEDKPLWKVEYEKIAATEGYIESLKEYLPELIKERLDLEKKKNEKLFLN